ncbi:MAG: enoyl-CoA hydratase/isomerase family protein [Actinobacteria bacterium]|nr:enoyl-CoA hydratase/isomerase family protein [Actinomycetota bacterium]
MNLTTVRYEIASGVATVSLDRPEVLNAFDLRMQRELRWTWREIRRDPAVRAVVLTQPLRGLRIARDDALLDRLAQHERVYVSLHYDGPGDNVGPKSCKLWKPVIAAVNGIACGGAFFMLGEVEFIVAAEHATFFVPHLSAGMASTFEAAHLLGSLPFGEVARMVLMGSHERLSAQRAHELGLVTQVTTAEDLLPIAQSLASEIAAHPPAAVEAAVRSLWMARDLGRPAALDLAPVVMAAGNRPSALLEGQREFATKRRQAPRIR